MSHETWLIGRKVDAAKNIFLATRILVFDFEFLIGERCPVVSDCEGTVPHLLDHCYLISSNRESVNLKGLTIVNKVYT